MRGKMEQRLVDNTKVHRHDLLGVVDGMYARFGNTEPIPATRHRKPVRSNGCRRCSIGKGDKDRECWH